MTQVGTPGSLANDIAVPQDNEDTISSLSWAPRADFLASASWDGKVRIYDVSSDGRARGVAVLKAGGPVLGCDWSHVSIPFLSLEGYISFSLDWFLIFVFGGLFLLCLWLFFCLLVLSLYIVLHLIWSCAVSFSVTWGHFLQDSSRISRPSSFFCALVLTPFSSSSSSPTR